MSGYTSVQFVGSVDAGLQPAFTEAVDFWNKVVKSGFQSYTFPFALDLMRIRCEVPVVIPAGTTLNGLLIFASTPPIDGVGSILGRAGPCLFSELLLPGNYETLMPVLGIMEFDSADADSLVDSGQFAAVVVHEMGHVLGIGTLWEVRGDLVDPCGLAGNNCNPKYSGEGGLEGYRQITDVEVGEMIPVENTGGLGTKNGHWRETVFINELMTGYLNPGNNPLSIMTVESLKDLGYTVDESAAEDYDFPEPVEVPNIESLTMELKQDILNFGYETVEEVVEKFGIRNEETVEDNKADFAGLFSIMILGFIIMGAAMYHLHKKTILAFERAQVEQSLATKSPMHFKKIGEKSIV